MISPVSSNSSQFQVGKAQAHTPPAPPKSKQQPEDTVQLSPEAKAAAAARDVDHDGDSH